MELTFTLKFESLKDQWLMLDNESQAYAMHCGDVFHIQIGKLQLPCRLEMDSDWYAICENVRFRLHPKEQYKITLY